MAQTSTTLSDDPSLYLLALLKSQPECKVVLDLIFCNDNGTDRIEAALSPTGVLLPLVRPARSHTKCYAYKTAESTKRDYCGVCPKI